MKSCCKAKSFQGRMSFSPKNAGKAVGETTVAKGLRGVAVGETKIRGGMKGSRSKSVYK